MLGDIVFTELPEKGSNVDKDGTAKGPDLDLISYVSKAMAWRAGDVLVTGTPGGVGFKRNPPIFMKPGDKVEVEVTQLGVLSNTIKDEII